MARRYVSRGASTPQEETMGLLDVLNGMQQGPRGPSNPSAQSSGGMSPMTMAILGLLAWKAVKHLSSSQPGASPAAAPSPGNVNAALPGGGMGGGLGDVLKGGLGGLLAGGAAGSVISGGLGDLLKQFQQNGHGDKAKSWIASGPNKQVSPSELEQALGPEKVSWLMRETGMSREDLLSGLSRELPGVVDKLTPDGRLPTDQEAARLL